MVRLAAELFLNSWFSNTVFVTLLRTAVETAISEVDKVLRHLLNIVVLAVAGGLFRLCWVGELRVGRAVDLYPTTVPTTRNPPIPRL